MIRYAIRRVLALIPTLLGVSIVVFGIIRLIPGDPATAMLGERGTEAQIQALKQQMGLDRPIYEQYVIWFGNVLRGDLGTSLTTNIRVTDEIGRKLPATIELSVVALLIAIALGLLLGVLAAIRRNSALDYGAMIVALVGVSMPVFWLGLMCIYVFAVNLHWLPPSSRSAESIDVRTNFYTVDTLLAGNFAAFGDVLIHLLMPAFVLSTVSLAVIARQTRSAMLEVLGQDYVRTAWAKGLRESSVIARHVLKNALLPVITVVGLQIGLLLGGAILTETVFSWPGMGTLTVSAIQSRDYPVIQGSVLVLAGLFVIVNLLVDLSYAWLDPRIKYA